MSLLYPMGFYIFYIWILAVINFLTRKKEVSEGNMSFKYFKHFSGEASEKVLVYGRHFDNQFQLPVVFLISCLALHTSQLTTPTSLFLAWGFVVSRFIHSYLHLGHNHILKRAASYALGWTFVVLMWALLLVKTSS